MKNQILEDLKNAMKQKDKEALSVIRMLKGAIQMSELDKKRELTNEEILAVISKEIKTRKESIKEFEKGAREDLINKTNSEIKVLEKYLPKQLSADELKNIIDKVIETIKPESIKDMGKVMKEVKPQVVGRADMSEVSKYIKEKLG